MPNAGTRCPVAASSARSVRPAVKKMRAAVAASPDQYARPRCDGAPCGNANRQISAPRIGAQRDDAIGGRSVEHRVDNERRKLRARERGAGQPRADTTRLGAARRRSSARSLERRIARAGEVAVIARPVRAPQILGHRSRARDLRRFRRLATGGEENGRQRRERPHSVAPCKPGVERRGRRTGS